MHNMYANWIRLCMGLNKQQEHGTHGSVQGLKNLGLCYHKQIPPCSFTITVEQSFTC